MANLHSVVERYGQPRQVAQFQGQVPFPSRVHKPGCRVNDQPDSTERAFAFNPGYQVLGEFDVLSGTTQDKIARMQNERLVLGNLDQIAEGFQAFLYINIGSLVVAKNQDFPIKMQVNTGRLNIRIVLRMDYDSPLSQSLFD